MSIGPFWVGDIPAGPLTITVTDDDGLAADLSDFTGVTVACTSPLGATVDGFTGSISGSTVLVAFPDDSPFAASGVYTLQVTLTSDDLWQTLPLERMIVQAVDGWVTLDDARAKWRDAPADDDTLFELLEIAKQQVVEFAPTAYDDDGNVITTPALMNYRLAQRMQARNLWNANQVDPGNGQIGADTFVIRPFPMDWVVKNIIRPAQPVTAWAG